ASLSSIGISTTHGAHHVAQIFTKRGFPAKSERRTVAPSGAVKGVSNIGEPRCDMSSLPDKPPLSSIDSICSISSLTCPAPSDCLSPDWPSQAASIAGKHRNRNNRFTNCSSDPNQRSNQFSRGLLDYGP